MKSCSSLLWLLLGAALLAGCERGDKGETEKPGKEPASSYAEKPGLVQLDAAAQKRLGISIAPLEPARAQAQIKAFGRVLDPSPLLKLALDLQSAQIALAASQAEFERVQILHTNENVSTRALQAAQAAALRDRVQLESLQAQIALEWGPRIAGHTNLFGWLEPLASRRELLVRFDISPGEAISNPPERAALITMANETNTVPVEFLAPATRVDPDTQTEGLLYLAQTNAVLLAPGAAVIGYLPKPGGARQGVIVPSSAVVRAQGRAWIYAQINSNQFTRQEILLDFPLANGWFVERGATPGLKVVTTGSSALFSEEVKHTFATE